MYLVCVRLPAPVDRRTSCYSTALEPSSALGGGAQAMQPERCLAVQAPAMGDRGNWAGVPIVDWQGCSIPLGGGVQFGLPTLPQGSVPPFDLTARPIVRSLRRLYHISPGHSRTTSAETLGR